MWGEYLLYFLQCHCSWYLSSFDHSFKIKILKIWGVGVRVGVRLGVGEGCSAAPGQIPLLLKRCLYLMQDLLSFHVTSS